MGKKSVPTIIKGQCTDFIDRLLSSSPVLKAGPSFGGFISRHPFVQTLCYSLRNRTGNPSFPENAPTCRTVLRLSDGGSVTLSLFRQGTPGGAPPLGWDHYTEDWADWPTDPGSEDKRPVVVMMHGLSGGAKTLAQHVGMFLGKGYRVVTMDRRGHDQDRLLTAPRYCTTGDWRDVKEVVEHLESLYPGCPLYGLGVSVGCGPLGSYLGKTGRDCRLRSAALISPTWNMDYTLEKTIADWSVRKLDAYLCKRMLAHVERNRTILEEFDSEVYRSVMESTSVVQVNRRQVPFTGWGSEEGMLENVNPFRSLDKSETPFLLLASTDDPLSTAGKEEKAVVAASQRGVMAETSLGGHCGFYAGFPLFQTHGYPHSWADEAVSEFFANH